MQHNSDRLSQKQLAEVLDINHRRTNRKEQLLMNPIKTATRVSPSKAHRDATPERPLHDDPVVVGLSTAPGIYYALCRKCGAYTEIRPSPQLAEGDLRADHIRGVLTVQRPLPLPPNEDDKVAVPITRGGG